MPSRAPVVSRCVGVPKLAVFVSGLPRQEQSRPWLDAATVATVPGSAALLVLGPEPLIAPQAVWLTVHDRPGPRVRVATNGLTPFAVETVP